MGWSILMKAQAHIRVYGNVQGVFFRMNTLEQARHYGVHGWIRNRQDGTVEALLQGEKMQIERVIAYCRHGPPTANVSNIEITWMEPRPLLHSFEITDTI